MTDCQSSTRVKTEVGLAAGLSFLAASANADIIGFEGVAASGSEVNVSLAHPYSEDGYAFSPSNGDSAIFDPAFGVVFLGDSTAFFGFRRRLEWPAFRSPPG